MAILRGHPPHGHAGHAQQTTATHVTVARSMGSVRAAPRRAKARRASRPASPSRVKAKRAAVSRGPMKKGSAAAKAWGAKMKRLRKRR